MVTIKSRDSTEILDSFLSRKANLLLAAGQALAACPSMNLDDSDAVSVAFSL